MKTSYSQMGQDLWVLSVLEGKHNGTFVDIGCATPFFLNNTALLETKYGWRGVAVDISPFGGRYHSPSIYERTDHPYPKEILDDPSLRTWDTRTNTKVYESDALVFDYDECFSKNNLPSVIDFLSIDLDPPQTTFEVFQLLPHDKYKFRTIAFEHDSYRMADPQAWEQHTREVITSYGYKWVKTQSQDDYYVLDNWQ